MSPDKAKNSLDFEVLYRKKGEFKKIEFDKENETFKIDFSGAVSQVHCDVLLDMFEERFDRLKNGEGSKVTDLYGEAELLDRAIKDKDWSKAESVLSMLKDKSSYEGDWKGVNEDNSNKGLKPDAWQNKEDGYYTYPSDKVHPDGENKAFDNRFEALFSIESIKEVIDETIKSYRNAKVENKGQHNVRAAKIQVLKELKKTFEEGGEALK